MKDDWQCLWLFAYLSQSKKRINITSNVGTNHLMFGPTFPPHWMKKCCLFEADGVPLVRANINSTLHVLAFVNDESHWNNTLVDLWCDSVRHSAAPVCESKLVQKKRGLTRICKRGRCVTPICPQWLTNRRTPLHPISHVSPLTPVWLLSEKLLKLVLWWHVYALIQVLCFDITGVRTFIFFFVFFALCQIK